MQRGGCFRDTALVAGGASEGHAVLAFLVPNFGPLSDSEKALLETYVKMSPQPEEFLKALLPEAQPDKFLCAGVFEKLERGAKGNLRNLFYMALACQPSTTWPRLAHQRHIFWAMLEQCKRGETQAARCGCV